ncbi:unnamed protein product [Colias eurytheme]|nr:unnamed protein product [Colias eurytheme]
MFLITPWLDHPKMSRNTSGTVKKVVAMLWHSHMHLRRHDIFKKELGVALRFCEKRWVESHAMDICNFKEIT